MARPEQGEGSGAPKETRIPEETKLVRDLTTEDMRRVAEITGGEFRQGQGADRSVTFIIYPRDGQIAQPLTLALRRFDSGSWLEVRGSGMERDIAAIWNPRVNSTFYGDSSVGLSEDAVTIRDEDTNGRDEDTNGKNFCEIVIKPGRVVCKEAFIVKKVEKTK